MLDGTRSRLGAVIDAGRQRDRGGRDSPRRAVIGAVIGVAERDSTRSWDRVAKQRAMRRRQLKWLWKRMQQIAEMKLTREELLMKLGSARSQASAAWRLVRITVGKQDASLGR